MSFESTNIKDYLVVPTCLQCPDLGYARFCQNEEWCSYCGENANKKNECPNKDKEKRAFLAISRTKK